MNTIKTLLTYYRFDVTKQGQLEAYNAMVLDLIAKGMTKDELHHVNDFNSKEFRSYWDTIRNNNGKLLDIETDHLFNNQLNTAPLEGSKSGLRVFDWRELVHPNRDIKEGYYLDITDELKEARRNTCACGYCGKQEPSAKGLVFCPHCLGSAYLKASELHLTRMIPISAKGDRQPLTETEKAYLLPLYKEAQIHGNNERDKARIKKEREDIEKEYKKSIEKATVKRDGLLWLMDHGINTDNVIYYDHTKQFCFGWRNALDDSVVAELSELLNGFPFSYEFKRA